MFDETETIDGNTKSWAAWKREAERLQKIIDEMTTNNHPAQGPVSLDRLHQIRETLSKAAAQSDGGNLGYAMADAVKVIDEVLSIPATLPCPVHLEPGLKFGKGVRTRCVLDALRRRADYYAELEAMTPEQLVEHDAWISEFKAIFGTPAPVVPDEMTPVQASRNYGGEVRGYRDGWNDCRAAMLQSDGTLTNEGTMQLSGNSEQIEPVSNRDELPLDYLQGHKDGLEWAAQMAEANNPQTGDWLYDDPIDLARAIRKGPDMPTVQGGNSPVTPDAWISCSERMPENIPGSCKEYLVFDGLNNKVHHDYWVVPDGDSAPVASFWNHYGAHVTHWMPLPEPPQEVN